MSEIANLLEEILFSICLIFGIPLIITFVFIFVFVFGSVLFIISMDITKKLCDFLGL